MKIALYSDLHTEFWPKSQKMEFLMDNSKICDVVVLAGDIASGRTNTLKVLKEFAKHYKHVVYTPGNHEYYGSDIDTFNDFPQTPKNVYYLNPGFVKIDDVTFIVAPLWTNFREDFLAAHAARSMIADFRLIKGFSPARAKDMFYKHFEFIKAMYEQTQGKKVIVTHFLPAVECIHPRFQGEGLLNNYFANDLGDWISNLSDTVWMFGHTHDSMDFMIGDTRMVCNPYGYHMHEENLGFNFEKVIEV